MCCVALTCWHTLQQDWSRCRIKQWWIESHRPLVCSFSESSRWFRSSQGSKAATGSQQHPSLWSKDLHPPLHGWRHIQSYVLLFDRCFIHLLLVEDALMYSLPKARYLCHFNSDLVLMLWWFYIKFSLETQHYVVAAKLDPVRIFTLKTPHIIWLLASTLTSVKTANYYSCLMYFFIAVQKHY